MYYIISQYQLLLYLLVAMNFNKDKDNLLLKLIVC